MGYNTSFLGSIYLDKPLDDDTYNLLKGINATRRMKRKLGPEYGTDGEYYVTGSDQLSSKSSDKDIVDFNTPPSTQPGLWCQWVPNDDKQSISWDQGEKFYAADKWMTYLINRILAPRGYVANGRIEAQGEDTSDHWWLEVINNKVKVHYIEDVLSKSEAFDILMEEFNNLPLYAGIGYISTLAKEILQKRLDGKIIVSLKE
jgi:hypothetical protein